MGFEVDTAQVGEEAIRLFGKGTSGQKVPQCNGSRNMGKTWTHS